MNPKRVRKWNGLCEQFVYLFKYPLVFFGSWLGFINIDYSYVHGDKSRLYIGKNCSTMNTIFNVNSGDIRIEDDTIFGHNCMLLTGTHKFYDGKRAYLHQEKFVEEVPLTGRDIFIGKGCFIGSGVIIVGPVHIDDHVIIGAGSVVTKDIESFSFVAGVPAKLVSSHYPDRE